jgi:uncharacterized membrane protein YfcA
MIFAILGALAVGLSLGIFGSGGSILTVPVLIYLLHHEDKVAIAESLGIVGAIALIGCLPYAKAKLVDWRVAVVFGVPGMAGTYLGAWAAAFVAGYVQLIVFAGVMLLAARQMWKRSKGPQRQAPDGGADDGAGGGTRHSRSAIKIVTDGLGVGVLTGFVGVGGGFLIVPALVILSGLSMRRAVATSLVIIALKSAAGFWKYLGVLDSMGSSVDWKTIGLFGAVGIVGSFAGKALSGRLNQNALQRGFAVFLVVMACFIVVKETASRFGADAGATGAASGQPVVVAQGAAERAGGRE